MSYDDNMASDDASEQLTTELSTATPGKFNRLKVNVSNLVYKCTFGKAGTPKPSCPYSK